MRARVVGEVYRLANPERGLALLDEVESFQPVAPQGSVFRREVVEVKLEDGTLVSAWV